MDRIPFTKAGYEALKEQVRQLKVVERPQVVKAIAEARAHGDLSENAEYEAAKNRQGFVEGKIRELEYKIAFADVIDPKTVKTDCAVFGCTVVLENLDTEEEVTYQLVGNGSTKSLISWHRSRGQKGRLLCRCEFYGQEAKSKRSFSPKSTARKTKNEYGFYDYSVLTE